MTKIMKKAYRMFKRRISPCYYIQTDEVIAHLLMMRGSEEKFWANANQHPVDRPAAGI